MTVQTEGVTPVAEEPPPREPAPGPATPAPRPRPSLPSGWLPYLLIAPAVLALAVFLGYPLVRNVLVSLQQLGRVEMISRATVWTGFDNYTELLGDSAFWTVVARTFAFMTVNVVLIMTCGTLIGLLLNRLGKTMRLVLSLSLVLAWAMPIVASATVFRWLFDTQFGVMNWVMRSLGFEGYEQHNWFETGFSTLAIVTLLVVWASIPFVALNMYAGLTTISGELYEAARVDGASAWRIFRSVVFPMLRPFFLITTFLEIIWVFKAFAQIVALNSGGPNRESETLPVFAYVEGMSQMNFGVAAAASVLTILILLVAMSFYFRLILKQEDEQ
ncbi:MULTISPECIES: carbohydrate ABC transporter permease [unclassified Streptomyces]|uniref:carbohydrate ABC transporter permease n=1 Tax=unclassified Streptomyces TaxID=2593676 RepID=UPI0022B6C520|nr:MULTISPECIES: sugar ABC transporter permease [unclassified Streptomyces]MCZ7416616.1 sugar ABC transporter permease [Streptomyces sp. WMMC897]MCZ7433571.1 sugar ABC transporter permease [Streptomyces sp. WMMC1477]